MRILFITNTPPIPSQGGAMTFYRHFCERDDFTIRVITSANTDIEKYPVPYPYVIVDRGKLWTRLSKGRLSRAAYTYSALVPPCIPEGVIEYAMAFKPDAVFTVGGSWSWMAMLAQKVAKKMQVPLIGSFNDWWYYNVICYPGFTKLVEWKFKQFYKDCNLALCTSEGMQKALGPHKNSIVSYPTGTSIKERFDFVPKPPDKTFVAAFGGNLGDWYGKMLESLILAGTDFGIQFRVFGANAAWSPEFDSYVREQNMYAGHISFEQLQLEMKQADGLLLLMGFDATIAIIESTSFKTKFLDYLTFQKPILLWGPSYCSAVAIAQEFNSAAICTSDSPEAFIKTIKHVKDNPDLQAELVCNALNMYEERFHPDKIHNKLKQAILALKKS